MSIEDQAERQGEGHRFNAWLQRQISRPDHVGNLAFEAWRDKGWPHDAEGPDVMKRYLLEERGIYGEKIYAAVDRAWTEFDQGELEQWKSPGGWLHEFADDTATWVKAAGGIENAEWD